MGSDVKQIKYSFPIVIDINNDIHRFKLSQTTILKRITKKENEEFWGIDKIVPDLTNVNLKRIKIIGHAATDQVVPSKKQGRYNWRNIMERHPFDNCGDILSSNYAVVIKIPSNSKIELINEAIEKVNAAFRIFRTTSTGGYIGFREGEKDAHFHSSYVLGGVCGYLENISRKDLEQIKKVFLLVEKCWHDKKFKLLNNIYSESIKKGVSAEVCFVNMVTILESIYLSESCDELTFKLSLRVAKLLSKLAKFDAEKIYQDIKEIYKIRCKIVHNGESKNVKILDWLGKCLWYARISLLFYLEDKNQFQEKNLEKLCLTS